MAQPTFLDTNLPRRGDTRWLRWAKALGRLQDRPGSKPANNPLRGDTIYVLKKKLLNAVRGTSYTG
jgi:hypothetical protein